MKLILALIIVTLAAIGVYALVSCSRQSERPVADEAAGAAEKAGAALDRAAQRTGAALNTAAEKTADAAKSGAEATQDATVRAMKKAGEVIEDAGASLEKTGEDMTEKGVSK